MKVKTRFLVVMGLTVAMSIASSYSQDDNETLGDKLKKLFHHPTPTPTPRRSHSRSSPYPSTGPVGTPAFSEEGRTPIPSSGETPTPGADSSASIESLAPVTSKTPEGQYFEPVRPINPGPRSRPVPQTSYPPPQAIPSASETLPPIPEIAEERSPEQRPVPSLPPVTGSGSQAAIPSEGDILESKDYSEDVRKRIALSLGIAKKNLNYKYASADPANGGLDCSGFIYYVLTNSGLKSVPRDAREQYVWVRKAGNFQAVLGHGEDTFELDALKPGDLLFWANESGVSHEPEITQTMIYIGRDKATNQRLMVGASEGGIYKGEKRSGVSVFDFKLAPTEKDADEPPTSVFVGYGRFPDLSGN